MGRVECFLGRVTSDEDWCPGVETTREAPALVRWSSLRQLGPGPGRSARGPGAGAGGQLAGWVTPSGDSSEAGWSPHPGLFPSLPFLCCLFPNQSLSWRLK